MKLPVQCTLHSVLNTTPSDHHVKEDQYLASVVMEMLDLEQDEMLCDHIREAVSAILGAVGAENPRKWLSLCKGVLSLAANSDGVSKQTDMVGFVG